MKLLKNIILITIAVILIVVIIMMIYIKLNNLDDSNYTYIEKIEENSAKYKNNLKKIENVNDFFMIKSCTNKWFETLFIKDSSDYNPLYEGMSGKLEKVHEETKESMYNILDPIYIEYKQITKENILDKITQIKEAEIYIKNVYVSQISDNRLLYFVYGNIYSENIQDFLIGINVDMDNKSFSVILEDYINEKFPDLQEGQNIEFQISETIELNKNNSINYDNVSQEEYLNYIIENFRKLAVYDQKLLYDNMMNKQYRDNRFVTYDMYINYMNKNISNFIKMNIKSYQINQYNDYTQYVCIDRNENYYIFNIKGIMDYEVILDTYTIDLPQFLEKYEEGNEQVKVGMNIEKFISAINAKDYRYAYNCLADSFKNNYYQTQESFEDYVKNNFFENNKIEYIQFSKEGNNYVYDIKILNTQGEEEKQATIIMQLQEGTEFVMSFSIE